VGFQPQEVAGRARRGSPAATLLSSGVDMGRLIYTAPRFTARGFRRAALMATALLGISIGLVAIGTSSASGVPLVSNWIALSPGSSPAPRTAAAMAYDPATGTIVLFGGDEVADGGTSTMLDDTWTFDAATSTWTEQTPTKSPPARYSASMVYDAATGDMVLFGGLGIDGYLNDTWTWNGATWTQAQPAKSPSARTSASIAYDAASQQVLLFGGLADRNPLGDTWSWNGTTWSSQTLTTKPAARYGAAMTYDASTGSVVLFGGDNTSAPLGDTWTWNGSSWTAQSSPISPPARVGASMAYDAVAGEAVLFGGFDGESTNDADTWTWSGNEWNALAPATSPAARRFAAMDYDTASATVVLFGGDPGGTIPSSLDDTWMWGSEGTLAVSVAASTTIVNGQDSATATLTGQSGAPAPTGTVSFFVCGPTSTPTPCTSQADQVGTAVTLNASTLNSASATSMAFTPTATGDWCFAVDYSGDTNYAPTTDNVDGCFVAEPPLATTPSVSTVTLGDTDTDVATVFGTLSGGVPTGTVSFFACGPTATPVGCTSQSDPVGTPVTVNASTGNNATATSMPFTPASVGYWCFGASYSGSVSYVGGPDSSTAECVRVNPVLSAAPAQTGIGLGTTDTDVATATGNSTDGIPTGTVGFFACGPTVVPTPCTSTTDPVGSPVTLNASTGPDASTATSIPFTPSAPGYWCFGSAYSGGGSYPASSDTTTDQCFDVNAVAPAFASPATATATTGRAFTFLVTVRGAPAPTITAARLPSWLTLDDHGNGTATLAATKARKGKHRFTLTASNSAGAVNQTFVLTVRRP
jgi:hypothetical protein